MDLGLLLLRLVVGALFFAHGTQKLFGWFQGAGPEGTGAMFDSLGYRPGRTFAVMAGVAEAGAGLLLFLGAFTPLAAAAVIGVMVNAIGSVHARNGLWNSDGGYEFPVVLIAAAGCLAFTGPGALSVDGSYAGTGWGFVALAVGVASGIAVLASRELTAGRTSKAEVAAAAEERQRRAA